MNISEFALSVIVMALILWGVSDFMEDEPVESSMTLPQGACDPAKTQVLRMDGSEQITQVIGRGVNCVVVMR